MCSLSFCLLSLILILSPSHTFHLILHVLSLDACKPFVWLGFLCLVLQWKQTDRHTLQPNEKGTTASTERKKIWRFARFCVVNFIWNTKMFGIHLLMLFHLRMGIEEKKKTVAMISIEKEWIEIRFFSLLSLTVRVYECEEMSNWRGVGHRPGLMAKENRFYFTFHISSSFFIRPETVIKFQVLISTYSLLVLVLVVLVRCL